MQAIHKFVMDNNLTYTFNIHNLWKMIQNVKKLGFTTCSGISLLNLSSLSISATIRSWLSFSVVLLKSRRSSLPPGLWFLKSTSSPYENDLYVQMCQVCVTGNLREQKSLKPGVMTSVHVNVFLWVLMQSSVPCREITSNFYKVFANQYLFF